MSRLDIRAGMLEVQTAVDEACTNIIKYAYSGQNGTITVTCDRQNNDFVVTIRDWGKPFDPESVSLPDLEADLDERKTGGLGIYLMKKLMDDVSYSFDARNGNTLVMRKRLIREEPKHYTKGTVQDPRRDGNE
jgi:anti-sigma regulatory factor (Ser/Thr protein kinase)